MLYTRPVTGYCCLWVAYGMTSSAPYVKGVGWFNAPDDHSSY